MIGNPYIIGYSEKLIGKIMSVEYGEEKKTFVVEMIQRRECDGTNLREGSVVNIIFKN